MYLFYGVIVPDNLIITISYIIGMKHALKHND